MRHGFQVLTLLVAVILFHISNNFIRALPVSSSIRINLKEQRIITHEGSTMQFESTISRRNENINSWKWFRNGKMIPSNKRFESQLKSNYTQANESFIIIRLNVRGVKLIDSGNWTVEVTSSNNYTVSQTASVTVFRRPVLKVQRSTVLIREGSPIFLVCFWTNNTHEKDFPVIRLRSLSGLQLGKWVNTRTNDNFYSVFMKPTSEVSDKGRYQCYSSLNDGVFTNQSRTIEVQIYTADDVVCQSSIDQYGIIWHNTLSNTMEYGSCPSGRNDIMADYGSWDLPTLRKELRKRNARISGRKRELVERLEAYDRNSNFGSAERVEREYCMQVPGYEKFKDINKDTQIVGVREEAVKAYLERMNKSVDSNVMYIYESKFLKYVRLCAENNFYYVKAECKAQMKKSVSYKVDVCVDMDGCIVESQCECAVGMGPTAACKHVCVVLFSFQMFCKSGDIVTEETCTQNLQTFHHTKVYKGSPIKANDLPLAGEVDVSYDPRPRAYRNMPGYPDTFRNVWLNHPNISNLAVSQIFPLANTIGLEKDHDYLSHPLSYIWLQNMNITNISDEDIVKLEEQTRGQSKSAIWRDERRKRIHSSNFGRICKATDKTDFLKLAENLTKHMPEIRVPAILHGRCYESVAIKKFEEKFNVKTSKCGIFVSKLHPFIASSPDAILDQRNSSRFCNASGMWNSTDVSYCYDNNLDVISEELDNIDAEVDDGTADEDSVAEVINNTLTETEVFTRNTSMPGDLKRTVNILERIVRLTNRSGNMVNNYKQSFFVSVDNMLSSRNDDAWTQLSARSDLSSAEFVMSLVDGFSVYVRQRRQNVNETDKFNGSNLEVKHGSVDLLQNVTFPNEGPEESFLLLPRQNEIKTGNSYTAVIYRTIANILPTELSNTSRVKMTMKLPVVNTPILSFTLDTTPDMLSPPLTLTFLPMNKTGDITSSVCVYWNFSSRNGLGGWDTDGCELVQSASNKITCQCNHLTNFAVLMSLDTDVADTEFLSTISLIGSCISIVFASLTVIVHILVWRYLKSAVVILLMNLCVTLSVSYLLFIVGTYASFNETACTVITFFLHSMLLVMFSMMQCIGVYYFRNIVIASIWLRLANRFSRRSNIPLFMGFGWGIPFVISSTTLGIFFNKTYRLSNHCWLSVDSGAIYFFIVPVCVVIFINFIIILALLKVSLSRMKGYATQTSQNQETSISAKARMALKNFGVLVPVLGITWIFGVMSINEDTEVFQYLFTISSSLQGLLIFIINVPLNKKLRDAFKKKFKFLETISSSQKSTGSSNQTLEQTSTNVKISQASKEPKKLEDTDVDDNGMIRISKVVSDWTTH
ncbi:uncharacterized protein LOC133184977 [Saccostrea echinata]|uniref:uncharacterized protein LOC133184977 n=1 Tax=Saccostrea echinata TaxID=191078 RepID=UPI002A816D56|nr:uncharacterized protein LOC133184977 [Saccostrea echinata]